MLVFLTLFLGSHEATLYAVVAIACSCLCRPAVSYGGIRPVLRHRLYLRSIRRSAHGSHWGGELIQSTRPQALIGFYAAVLLTGLASVVLSRWALLDWNWRWKVKI